MGDPEFGRSPGPISDEGLLAAQVARRHFRERLSNQEIARDLGISRFRVARLIEQALETGLVQIIITPPANLDDELSSALRARYQLKEALVLASTTTGDPSPRSPVDSATLRAGVAQLAGQYLSQLCRESMVIGVSWGRTLDEIAAAMEGIPRRTRCDVVQLVGNLATLEGSLHAGDVLRRFSNVLRGRTYALHAPLVVHSEAAARAFKSEESVARTLAAMSRIDVAVVGIGSWNPASSLLMEILPEKELRLAESVNPVADVCAILIDDAGREIGESLRQRRIGITREGLAAIPMVIGVAAGPEKARAVRAALASGTLDCLVVDADIAVSLLGDGLGSR